MIQGFKRFITRLMLFSYLLLQHKRNKEWCWFSFYLRSTFYKAITDTRFWFLWLTQPKYVGNFLERFVILDAINISHFWDMLKIFIRMMVFDYISLWEVENSSEYNNWRCSGSNKKTTVSQRLILEKYPS